MKEKNIGLSTKKKHKWTIVGLVFAYLSMTVSLVIMDSKPLKSCLKHFKISPGLFMLFALLWLAFTICITYYNELRKFSSDTIYLFGFYFLEGGLLLVISILLSNYKFSSKNAQEISYVFLGSGLFFWTIYYFRCLKVIKELNKDTFYFFIRSLMLVSSALLVWWASNNAIGAFDVKTDYIYQFLSIFVNFSYPLIGMFTYVHPEIDEFDKLENPKNELEKTRNELENPKNELEKTRNELEKTRNELEKTRNEVEKTRNEVGKTRNEVGKTRNEVEKTRNEVERFINRFKIIDYQRRTEKNNTSMLKRLVNKFATLEDLDNLEKIIVEKRNELENNNDTEKDMD